jgi:hypothetical protein
MEASVTPKSSAASLAFGKCAFSCGVSGATPSAGVDAAETRPPQKASKVTSKMGNSSGRVASTVRSARWTSGRSPRSTTSSARIASWLSDGVIASPRARRRRQNRTVPVRRSRGRGAAAVVIVVGGRGSRLPVRGSRQAGLAQPRAARGRAGGQVGLDALHVVDLLRTQPSVAHDRRRVVGVGATWRRPSRGSQPRRGPSGAAGAGGFCITCAIAPRALVDPAPGRRRWTFSKEG